MIGMQFGSFILLLIIGVVISLILHYGLQFYVTPGTRSFLGKVVVGWLGGWLGSPVLGHWGPSVNVDQVFIIPAILSLVGAILLMVGDRTTEVEKRQNAPVQVVEPVMSGK